MVAARVPVMLEGVESVGQNRHASCAGFDSDKIPTGFPIVRGTQSATAVPFRYFENPSSGSHPNRFPSGSRPEEMIPAPLSPETVTSRYGCRLDFQPDSTRFPPGFPKQLSFRVQSFPESEDIFSTQTLEPHRCTPPRFPAESGGGDHFVSGYGR